MCDLLVHATNHGLSIRRFGSTPVAVAALTAAVIGGLQRAGVAASAKHFPGKGAARVDTHYEQAIIDRSRAEFEAAELVPFRAAIDAGVRLMMSSHAIVPALSGGDPPPATRSRAVLTGLLRDGLGFTGVTITDALDMAAVGEGRSGHRLTEICAQDPAEREDRCRFRVVVESLDPKYVRLVPLSGKIGADFGAGG